jgi:hypothetical protein
MWLTKGEVGMFCGGVTYRREGDANQRRTAKLVKNNTPANETTGLALFKTRKHEMMGRETGGRDLHNNKRLSNRQHGTSEPNIPRSLKNT